MTRDERLQRYFEYRKSLLSTESQRVMEAIDPDYACTRIMWEEQFIFEERNGYPNKPEENGSGI